MKRILIAMFIAFLTISFAYAADLEITHELPANFSVEKEFKGTVTIAPTDEVPYDVSVLLPAGSKIFNWIVQNNNTPISEERSTISYEGNVREMIHWSFTGANNQQLTINYFAKPALGGEENIVLLWTHESGFGKIEDPIYVFSPEFTLEALCGNNACESLYGESLLNCPEDCRFKLQENAWYWVGLFIVFLLIIMIGLGYREYKKYGFHLSLGRRKPRMPPKSPSAPIRKYGQPKLVIISRRASKPRPKTGHPFPIEPARQVKPVSSAMPRPVKRKPAKKVIKKPLVKKTVKKKPKLKKIIKKKSVKIKTVKKKPVKKTKKKPKTKKKSKSKKPSYDKTISRLKKLRKQLR